jgi:putative ABC transport system substrate-binding protein
MAAEHRALPLSRRRFVQGASLASLGLLAGCGRLPGQAQQPSRVVRIGFLSGNTPAAAASAVEAFRQGLRALGYLEGENLVLEWRWAEGHLDRLPTLAAELIHLRVDIIAASTTPAVAAAQQATQTIPIVFAGIAEPVESGLVASVARPGGNLTGLATRNDELHAKRLEFLKEAFPTVARVGFLFNPEDVSNTLGWQAIQGAAPLLRLALRPLLVRSPEDLDGTFEAALQAQLDGLVCAAGAVIASQRARILAFAADSRLPAIYGQLDFTDAGGLMAYAANFPEQWRRAATFVDKILNGAKPADLPVEQPMRFEFVINLKTAQALGLTIPPHVLLQATEVIQ